VYALQKLIEVGAALKKKWHNWQGNCTVCMSKMSRIFTRVAIFLHQTSKECDELKQVWAFRHIFCSKTKHQVLELHPLYCEVLGMSNCVMSTKPVTNSCPHFIFHSLSCPVWNLLYTPTHVILFLEYTF